MPFDRTHREEFTLRHDLNDVEAARQHEIQYERRQRHVQAITDLYFKFPTYAQAVRLFKRCGIPKILDHLLPC